METQGYTYKYMEIETGIKSGTFGSWFKRGDTYPSVDNALKIAKALGVSVEFLMTGKEFVENKVENGTVKNILSYLQDQDEVNLHRIEGVLMALGFLSNRQNFEQKGELGEEATG